ncbi:hypothetical protein Q4S45_06770 [Massilia sp. R2A-15]|uniref:hypothetical protein n=1 Tax=Massilia sp. R2A-15 TaxID=3064278 RepID=UPI0027367920|nr:hypothetical protein [Massilia sp. R2A-15]WLI90813.1 hypothetical protein Q4S45_06770 [Massilia sp. R2A-15]
MAAGLCISAATMAATWYWQGAHTAAPTETPAPRAAGWDGPIGPGQVRAEAPAATVAADNGSGLTVDASGHLVPDQALHALIDNALAHADAASVAARVEELRGYFQTRLPATAAQDGQRILNDYLQYLRVRQAARSRLTPLEGPGLTDTDIAFLLAWQAQQAQLRERMLGATLAKAWFAQSDSRCDAVLRDLSAQRSGDQSDPMAIRERRLHGAAQEAIRGADAQSCADQLMANFSQGGQ